MQRTRVRTVQQMMQFLRGLTDRFEACFGVSCGYGHFYDLVLPIASRVVVTHPGQLRLIVRSRDKNDRNDAERLAKLLCLGETPTVHVPAVEVRMWRELINCRSQLIATPRQAPRFLAAV